MGKTKVKVTKKKVKKAAPESKGQPKLIGSKKHRTIISYKYNSKGKRRRPGWK